MSLLLVTILITISIFQQSCKSSSYSRTYTAILHHTLRQAINRTMSLITAIPAITVILSIMVCTILLPLAVEPSYH